ncbi:MAG: GTP-binding protein [Spirochaetales bacterium]|nr:GTP-binding protein [Spirochaetales bacterium]
MNSEMKEQMNIVITGHVDHGKSTVIGRMLADTGSLPEGKLESVKKNCERNSKPFEYAFLLDALKDEQAQGITIDAARVFFNTEQRDYIILDAPGHIEFLKNMVTGAARAEAAFLVIDADEGIQENSKRHGYLLSMLGIRQLCVLVNKMDLVDYSQRTFRQIERKYSRFLKNLDMTDVSFIPVSGREGDNIASLSKNMPWWTSNTVLSLLDSFKKEEKPTDMPFRMAVQDVYKFTNEGDSRRIIAGTIDSGELHKDDELIFYPSGKKSKVDSIEVFNGEPPEVVGPGQATGFTMTEQIYAKRGNLVAKVGEKQPQVGNVFRVSLFWLGKKPLEKGKDYILKVGTDRVKMQLFDTIRVIDASNLNADNMKKMVGRHDVAECVFTTKRAIAFDLVEDLPSASRFVIVDDYEIAGGGIIREVVKDSMASHRKDAMHLNFSWETGNVSAAERVKALGHKSQLVLVSGEEAVGKSEMSKALERRLFDRGCNVVYLGMTSFQEDGEEADYGDSRRGRRMAAHEREEMIHRLALFAKMSMEGGAILVVSCSELTSEEREVIAMAIEPHSMKTVWLGKDLTTDLKPDYQIMNVSEAVTEAEKIEALLVDEEIILK